MFEDSHVQIVIIARGSQIYLHGRQVSLSLFTAPTRSTGSCQKNTVCNGMILYYYYIIILYFIVLCIICFFLFSLEYFLFLFFHFIFNSIQFSISFFFSFFFKKK